MSRPVRLGKEQKGKVSRIQADIPTPDHRELKAKLAAQGDTLATWLRQTIKKRIR